MLVVSTHDNLHVLRYCFRVACLFPWGDKEVNEGWFVANVSSISWTIKI